MFILIHALSIVTHIIRLFTHTLPHTPPEISHSSPHSFTHTCGLPNRKMRLVGGSWSEINEYPWMVALLYKGHFYCGGTLISDRYVLTAAHCIEGVNVNNLRVMVGDHVRSFPIETKSRDYQAVYSVYHHEFNRSTYNHDIGLVKLGQKVEYKWYSRPACLPQPNFGCTFLVFCLHLQSFDSAFNTRYSWHSLSTLAVKGFLASWSEIQYDWYPATHSPPQGVVQKSYSYSLYD
ncbi:ovochymase-2-like [Penaeus indicus]|uniref:ovochymase-2-like n=1 Tax=Penaeus indicus TaxID=29960 RepID=UPI00300C3EC5